MGDAPKSGVNVTLGAPFEGHARVGLTYFCDRSPHVLKRNPCDERTVRCTPWTQCGTALSEFGIPGHPSAMTNSSRPEVQLTGPWVQGVLEVGTPALVTGVRR